MIYLGHKEIVDALFGYLSGWAADGFKRIARKSADESILMDSNPAPDYVPGVKRIKGQRYVPAVNGTYGEVYYIAGDKPTVRAKLESHRAARNGDDLRILRGRIIAIRRLADGGVQLQMTCTNRDNKEDPEAVSFRSPSSSCGIFVALALDQSLGIPPHQLAELALAELLEETGEMETGGKLVKDMREAYARAKAATESEGADPARAPVKNPEEAK